MTKKSIVIATRESPLALAQANIVKGLLLQQYPTLEVSLLGLTTTGDKQLNVSLFDIGGKGLFVKELEEALLDGRADIAVHSMKDVPMQLPDGFAVPVMLTREDPRDAFLSINYPSLESLPAGAKVGTSSLRRQAQLQVLRPDLSYMNLRGNINTRIKRLKAGDFDTIILAAAGLKRMGLTADIRSYLSINECLPAAGQGALGIECLSDNIEIAALIAPLNDQKTKLCVQAERAMCRRLGGGCKVPIAAYAQIQNPSSSQDLITGSKPQLDLQGLVANADGSVILRAQLTGVPEDAEIIGTAVAKDLVAQGAEEILRTLNE